MGRLTILGADGKHYPPGAPSTAERRRIAALAHGLRHSGLSVRQVQAALEDHYGIRRSLGSVQGMLTGLECPSCPRVIAARQAAQPRPRAKVVAWH